MKALKYDNKKGFYQVKSFLLCLLVPIKRLSELDIKK